MLLAHALENDSCRRPAQGRRQPAWSASPELAAAGLVGQPGAGDIWPAWLSWGGAGKSAMLSTRCLPAACSDKGTQK